jgi:hypothetical protein
VVVKHQDGSQDTHGMPLHPVQLVTSAPQSAAEEQAQRMRRYLATMAFRVVCTILAIVASGWLRWTFVAAAVVIPYFAVVMANAVRPRAAHEVTPVDQNPDEVPALDHSAADEPDRTIHGHVVD